MNGHQVWIINREELKAAYPREWATWEKREQQRAQLRRRPQRQDNASVAL
jgi:hypothetical protein